MVGLIWKLNYLREGPKIKKRKIMVFDHRGGAGGHPKPNPYLDQIL